MKVGKRVSLKKCKKGENQSPKQRRGGEKKAGRGVPPKEERSTTTLRPVKMEMQRKEILKNCKRKPGRKSLDPTLENGRW